MLHNEENMNQQSKIPPPGTRLPKAFSASTSGTSSHLQDITGSQSNARAQTATQVSALKRGLPTSAPQPEAKRKPLYELAGEYKTKSGAAPVSTGGRGHIRGYSAKDLGRHQQFSSSFAGPRTTSNNSYASSTSHGSSVGPGARPPSRPHARARSATRPARPATAMSMRIDEGQGNNVNDIDERVVRMDTELQKVKEFMDFTEKNSVSVKEELETAKRRVVMLEDERIELRSARAQIMDQLEDSKRAARRLERDLEDQKDQHDRHSKNLEDDHRRELDKRDVEFARKMDEVVKLQQELEHEHDAQAEVRLENLTHENKDLRNTLERQKRDQEHEIKILNEEVQRRESQLHHVEDVLRKTEQDQRGLETQIRGHLETIDRLRRRAEDAEESLSKDKGHLGGQISLLSSALDLKAERIQQLEEETKALQAKCQQEVEATKLAAQKQIEEETASLTQRLLKEEERRHKLFEQVQELKGNIRVMCRIKPPSNPEKDALVPFKPKRSDLDEEKIDGLSIPTMREDPTEPGKMLPGKPRDFSFERVFDEKATNGDVFDEISQLVQSVMDGKKVCIFCYGQTGSGKTFTMSRRSGGDDGVIPRTQQMIFGEAERLRALGWEYRVEGSYLEVYQDKLYDLLASRHTRPEPLQVDLSPGCADELHIKGHEFTELRGEADLDAMVRTADENRHVAATAKNDRSSRSHSILVLKIAGTQTRPNAETGEPEVVATRRGTLNLVDLAGSERPDREHPSYAEGVQINSSLSYLRTVLAGLGQGRTDGVDFRSFTLTQLLRPSLGRGCRTLMFVMVSPLRENENETIRSLEFARDAQKVKMGGGGGAKSRR
ncbi:P-loop containing nucleoside triphosphate hydrolase protein [Xylariaceae sp. FL0804]|nr:P-loop containing nucleoside triphosphate hydrolase protein [Xylariaceae sp. FL0804]